VNGDGVRARNSSVGQLVYRNHGQLRKQGTQSATYQAQSHSFRKHLLDQPHTAGAQRRPHSELLLASEAARNQQVRYVGAGDEQHQGQGAEEPKQNRRTGPVRTS